MRSYHCELAWLGGDTAVADVLVSTDGGSITAVTPGVVPPDDAIGLAGLTLPGLANAHSHAFHRVLRSRTQQNRGSFWTWREQMYAVAATLDPDGYFELARAVYGEMVLAGVTCVGEFHYVHHAPGGVPYADPNAMGAALVAAANEAGLRITLLDTCYLHGGIGPAGGTALDPVQQRFSDGSAEAWAERVASAATALPAHARLGAAVHSVRAVDPRSIETVAAWARAHDVPLHAHVSEQPAENEQCLATYGLTPTALLSERGALGPLFTAVHATHCTPDDLGLLGAAGAAVCLCPTTERDLADGVCHPLTGAATGITVTLGSDSHAVIDLFEEARGVETHQRLATGVRGHHDAAGLLRAATADGHASLGWPEAGSIAVGAVADLVSVRLDSVRTAGARPPHALDTAVFAATAADVHHVVVGGRVVVAEGRHRTLDVAGELAREVARW